MNFDRFYQLYTVHKMIPGEQPVVHDAIASAGINNLPVALFNDGVYAIVARDEASTLTRLVEAVFPVATGKIAVFAVDWMGRMFATDTGILDESGAATISCFDFAEPSSFTTEVNFQVFHNSTAVDMASDLFNLEQLDQWRLRGKMPNDGSSCIGYKVPLFLGGKDTPDNMEMANRSVYLHLLVELWASVSNLPEGTVVNRVELE